MAASSGQDVVAELDGLLLSMQSLKPPGANKSKIEGITKICTAKENAHNQQAFVNTILDAYGRSVNSHKLGVMYIVDTVTRQWIAGGSEWATGVKKMTSSLPPLMADMIRTAPALQKEKIGKLIDIWDSCKTFPPSQLETFHRQLAASTSSADTNSGDRSDQARAPLPTASVAQPNYATQYPQPMTAAPPAADLSTNPLLAALSGIAQVPPPNPVAIPAVPGYPMGMQYPTQAAQQSIPPPTAPYTYPMAANPISAAQAPQQPAPANNAAFASNPLASLLAMSMAQGAANGGVQPAQMQMLQQLVSQLRPDQLAGVITALAGQTAQTSTPPTGAGAIAPPPSMIPQTYGNMQNQMGVNNGMGATPPAQVGNYPQADNYTSNDPRDRSAAGYDQYGRNSLDRRGSPSGGGGGQYDTRNQQTRGNDYDRKGGRAQGRGAYEDRSDPRRSPPSASQPQMLSPSSRDRVPVPNPQPFDYDAALEPSHIRVLSRTLFVGGVRTSEHELKQFFSQFRPVQSCIVNHEKRHAFLKTFSHDDCIKIKAAVASIPSETHRGLFERVGWAVGFGPTEFSDYTSGTSKLPLSVLTEADRKWVMSAEFGGSGGKTLQGGMVIEEPDIEIGAGPSSKAISRRGGGAPQGQRHHGGGSNHNRRGNFRHEPYKKPDRSDHRHGGHSSNTSEVNTLGPPPAVPTFGAPIPGFPPNFR